MLKRMILLAAVLLGLLSVVPVSADDLPYPPSCAPNCAR